MSDFINDGASVLPPVKSDQRIATGAASEWAAQDTNKIRQVLLDVRSNALAIQSGFVNPDNALVTATGSTTPRYLSSRFSDVTNVKDFGAAGDGLTDDTAAFASAASAGKHIYVPEGTYLLDSFTISDNGYVFEGASPRTTVLKARSAGTSKLLKIQGSGAFAQNNVIRNFTLDMTSQADVAGSVGLYLAQTWGNVVEQVYVTGNGTNKISLLIDTPGTLAQRIYIKSAGAWVNALA